LPLPFRHHRVSLGVIDHRHSGGRRLTAATGQSIELRDLIPT
jgi:hypothetical protein